jgi:hypothetical protein
MKNTKRTHLSAKLYLTDTYDELNLHTLLLLSKLLVSRDTMTTMGLQKQVKAAQKEEPDHCWSGSSRPAESVAASFNKNQIVCWKMKRRL